MSEQLRHIGYMLTSLNGQNPIVQADALQKAGGDSIYQPTVSENPPVRETFQELMNFLGGSDELLAYRLDCLAYDEHIRVNLQKQPQALGVTLVVTGNQKEAGESDEK